MKRKEFLQQGMKGMIGLSGMATLLYACTKKIGSPDDQGDDGNPDDTGANTGGVPLLLATDIIAGPTTGGENNKGAYVSIFGINFET